MRGLSRIIFGIAAGALIAAPLGAAPKRKADKAAEEKLRKDCDSCLALFSARTLKFAGNAGKCINLLSQCDKANRASKCEPVINDCIDENCSAPGSCSNAMSNRALFVGCLKAENKFLPYQCAATISGMASSLASQIAEEQAAAERAHEAQLAQADAERAAADAQAKEAQARAAADAEREKAASAERMKQAELANQLKLQQEKFALEQKAASAERAAAKQAELDARNSRPSAMFTNAFKDIQAGLAKARSFTSKLFSGMGIRKTDGTEAQSNLMTFAPPTISTNEIEPEIYDDDCTNAVKTKGTCKSTHKRAWAAKKSSRYLQHSSWKCTIDAKEAAVKTDLDNARKELASTSNKLANYIQRIESNNQDEDASDTLGNERLDALYAAQGHIDDLATRLDEYAGKLKTTCNTLCAGMSTMPSFGSSKKIGPVTFDENGDIIKPEEEKAAPGYSCKEFSNDTTKPSMASIIAGTANSNTMIGGIGAQANELTLRVLESVVQSDFSINEAEVKIAFEQDIALSTESSGSSWGTKNFKAVEDSCKQETISSASESNYSNISSCLNAIYAVTAFSLNNREQDAISKILALIQSQLASINCVSGYGGMCCNGLYNLNNVADMRQCSFNMLSKISANTNNGNLGYGNGGFRIVQYSAIYNHDSNECVLNYIQVIKNDGYLAKFDKDLSNLTTVDAQTLGWKSIQYQGPRQPEYNGRGNQTNYTCPSHNNNNIIILCTDDRSFTGEDFNSNKKRCN
ncbi:MAG: hypothetical protein LBH41_01155 [Rickettsiales bacterium]|jgi:hypothetical protein|nr:hypothetical protein [Rickettsiales bacterium]